MKDEIKVFLNKVQEMRQAQNAFFKFSGDSEKKKEVLIKSKQLETYVDIESQRMQAALSAADELELGERQAIIGDLEHLYSNVGTQARVIIDSMITSLQKGGPKC